MQSKKYWTPKNRRRLIVAVIIMNFILGIIAGGLILQRFQTTSNSNENAVMSNLVDEPKFVLASWDYPDEYGQGLFKMIVYENSTGGWLIVDDWIYWDDPTVVYEWNISVGIKVRVLTTLNATLTGAASVTEGKNYLRHSVNVTTSIFGNGLTTVFSQQNFTESGTPDEEGDIYYYDYAVILNFLPDYGQVYTVTVDYEIYYEVIEEEYKHDCSSVNGITYYDNSNLGASDYGIGSDGNSVEFWILPDDALSEGVIYKLDFANIINPDGDINITVRYKIEGVTNNFWYRVYYDDANYSISNPGLSQTWANLVLTPETGKTLDYIYLYNYDTPPSVASGNLSVWIDYIEIDRFLGEGWNLINTAILQFVVELFTGSLDAWVILLGLAMIPASTLFLVRGGKDDLSHDKVFYFLIIFFFGWALFLGGIMP